MEKGNDTLWDTWLRGNVVSIEGRGHLGRLPGAGGPGAGPGQMDRFLFVIWERTLRHKGQHGSSLASGDQAMRTQELWNLGVPGGGFLRGVPYGGAL